MTKQQLVEQVAIITGQTKLNVERTLEAILKKLAEALVSGEKIDLRGFGVLATKTTKARVGRNPGTGEPINIPASRKTTFRPGKDLKQQLTGEAVASPSDI